MAFYFTAGPKGNVTPSAQGTFPGGPTCQAFPPDGRQAIFRDARVERLTYRKLPVRTDRKRTEPPQFQ
jgi:hypothetical protein